MLANEPVLACLRAFSPNRVFRTEILCSLVLIVQVRRFFSTNKEELKDLIQVYLGAFYT